MTDEVVEEVVTEAAVTTPSIPKGKKVTELTDAEKKLLYENAQKGIFSDEYKVKTFKNGSYRITKQKAPSLTEKIIRSEGHREDQKVYYTDQQFIIEHLIDLESKYARLYGKHKKLKSQLYDYEDADEGSVPVKEAQPKEQVIKEELVREEPPVKEQASPYTKRKPVPGNWRQQLAAVNAYMK